MRVQGVFLCLVAMSVCLSAHAGTAFVTQLYDATGLPTPITDAGTIGSDIEVGNVSSVNGVRVLVNIQHPFTGDLDLSLRSPEGTIVELASDNGGAGDNYTATLFSDLAATSINEGAAPFTGSFRPELPLSAVIGQPTDGTWTLLVTDDTSDDIGNLLSWQLQLDFEKDISCSGEGASGGPVADFDVERFARFISESGAVHSIVPYINITGSNLGDLELTLVSPSGTEVNLSSDNGDGIALSNTQIAFDDEALVDIRDVTTPLVATYQPELPLTTFRGESLSGTWELFVADDNAGGGSTVLSWGLTYCYGSAEDIIEGEADGICSGNSNLTVINVPDNNVTGIESDITVAESGTLFELEVELNIEHPYAADLEVVLKSPDGTSIDLMLDNGVSVPLESNYIKYTDKAAHSIAELGVPTYVTYRPLDPLSTFDGKEVNGIWRLFVGDDGADDEGKLNGWSMSYCYVPPVAEGEGEGVTEGAGEGVVEGEGEGIPEGEGEGVVEGEGEGIAEGEGEGVVEGEGEGIAEGEGEAPVNSCQGGIGSQDDTVGSTVSASDSSLYAIWVNRMTPPSYPYTLSDVCVGLISTSATSINYNIVVYQDDAGRPGDLLAVTGQYTEALPTETLHFISTDVSAESIVLSAGSYHVAIQYAPTQAPGISWALDNSAPFGPTAFFQNSTNPGSWSTLSGPFDEPKQLMISAKGTTPPPVADCEAGLAEDDGITIGAASVSSTAFFGSIVTRLTPPIYPYNLNSVCVCLGASGAATTLNYDVVVYTDAGGQPGTILFTVPGQTATSIPVGGAFYKSEFLAEQSLTAGSYYVGIQYNPATADGVFVCTDSTPPAAPVSYSQSNANPGVWSSLGGNQQAMIRADGTFQLFGHAADDNSNGELELTELLRIIQLFNAGELHCDAGTTDGYTPGDGAQTCARHTADYQDPPWEIDFSELIRSIQVFNLRDYFLCPDGPNPDGVCFGIV